MSGLPERPLAGRRVLVTGASGFLGQHVAAAFLAAGAEVHGLSRRPPEGLSRIGWHLGDVTDEARLAAVVVALKPAVVCHLAAYGTTFGEDDRERAFAVNVAGGLALWRALGDRDVRLVLAGTCGEYGRLTREEGPVDETHACAPTWFYPATKHALVTLLSTLGRETGREVVTLRPFGPFGPGDSSNRLIPDVTRRLLRGEVVETTAGEQQRDFLHVRDHAAAFVAAATRPLPATGAIYNVGSGVAVTVREVIAAIAREVGGDALARVHFGALPYRDSEVWNLCARIDAARRDLAWAPATPFADGIAETIAWHRAESTR